MEQQMEEIKEQQMEEIKEQQMEEIREQQTQAYQEKIKEAKEILSPRNFNKKFTLGCYAAAGLNLLGTAPFVNPSLALAASGAAWLISKFSNCTEVNDLTNGEQAKTDILAIEKEKSSQEQFANRADMFIGGITTAGTLIAKKTPVTPILTLFTTIATVIAAKNAVKNMNKSQEQKYNAQSEIETLEYRENLSPSL